MGGTRKKPAKDKTAGDSGKKPPSEAVERDEEDGDFATPKGDRDYPEDEPA